MVDRNQVPFRIAQGQNGSNQRFAGGCLPTGTNFAWLKQRRVAPQQDPPMPKTRKANRFLLLPAKQLDPPQSTGDKNSPLALPTASNAHTKSGKSAERSRSRADPAMSVDMPCSAAESEIEFKSAVKNLLTYADMEVADTTGNYTTSASGSSFKPTIACRWTPLETPNTEKRRLQTLQDPRTKGRLQRSSTGKHQRVQQLRKRLIGILNTWA